MPPHQNLLLALILSTATTATATEGIEETWWINSAKKDCVGVAPMTCYEIQHEETLDPQAWALFYSQIKGFTYEPGYLYRISVRITDRAPPLPADVSSKVYTLLEVLSKEPDPGLRLANLWKVETVGELSDVVNRAGEPLLFEFNASQRSYAGDLGCNRVHGSIAQNDGERLQLGPGMTTRMACEDMRAERAVLSALNAVHRYTLDNRTLRFLDNAGNELMTFLAVD